MLPKNFSKCNCKILILHGRRLSMLPVGLAPLEISVAKDKLVGIVAESTSNIWMAELGKE